MQRGFYTRRNFRFTLDNFEATQQRPSLPSVYQNLKRVLLKREPSSTQLHPAPPSSTKLHPPPASSFQPPLSSLQHPQQYLNQNIAIFEISTPNSTFGQIWAQRFKFVRFVCKSVHIVSQGWRFRIQTQIFETPTSKGIFGQIWAEKVRVVRFSSKLVRMASSRC